MVAVDLGTYERRDSGRSVNFEFHLGTLDAQGGYGEREVLTVLTVSHDKAGANYFSGEHTTTDTFTVTLRNETVEDRGNGFVARGFMVGRGVRLARYDAGSRFSRKRLEEAATRALGDLEDLVNDGNEQVLRYFDMAAFEADR
jgi:hypothetical protein